MADNYQINDTYNFLDSLRQSHASGRTLRETILMHETAVEDPRVPKELRVLETEKRRQALFADEMQRLIVHPCNEGAKTMKASDPRLCRKISSLRPDAVQPEKKPLDARSSFPTKPCTTPEMDRVQQ